jgi:hypothetical protein
VTPEQEILHDLLGQADRSAAGLVGTIAMIADFPADETAFDTMSDLKSMATTAMLKQVEQLEGSLHGAFRVALKMMGVSLKGLYPLDIGERMAELGVIDDGATWLAAVKLRNELVHEYLFDLRSRFIRTRDAFSMAATLQDAVPRLRRFIIERKLL